MNDAPATWTKEAVINLLKTNDRAVERALVVLYQRQTAQEQTADQTRELNGVGFGAWDAEYFSSLAKQVLKGQRLSGAQLSHCRRPTRGRNIRIGRYWAQLLDAIAAKERATGYVAPPPKTQPELTLN